MTCRACRNHLSDVPEPCGGQSGITCWACATTSETYQNHMPCRLEPPTGQTGIHLANTPESLAGHAGTTSQTCQNPVPMTPEAPAEHAGTTCSTRQNHLPITQKSPAGYATTSW
ncbi:Uncharacterised protein [Mycobacteroides abscessus subsp. abscessus]|nr:Uncharacterised protein [Mycobacteroides abscessus subsp. abscessus]